jgi:hypothetical protein
MYLGKVGRHSNSSLQELRMRFFPSRCKVGRQLLISSPGLPDGIVSDQKSPFGLFLKCLAMPLEDFGLFMDWAEIWYKYLW